MLKAKKAWDYTLGLSIRHRVAVKTDRSRKFEWDSETMIDILSQNADVVSSSLIYLDDMKD